MMRNIPVKNPTDPKNPPNKFNTPLKIATIMMITLITLIDAFPANATQVRQGELVASKSKESFSANSSNCARVLFQIVQGIWKKEMIISHNP